MLRKVISTENEYGATILRLTMGIMFFAHGAQKALGWFGGYGFHATLTSFTQMMHIPAVLAILAMAAEFLGGLGLVAGLLTRIAALGIAVNMAVAVALVHHRFGFFMNWTGRNKGEGYEFHLLAIAAAVALMIEGGGAISIDRLLTRRKG